jgi:hypothetical protein
MPADFGELTLVTPQALARAIRIPDAQIFADCWGSVFSTSFLQKDPARPVVINRIEPGRAPQWWPKQAASMMLRRFIKLGIAARSAFLRFGEDGCSPNLKQAAATFLPC